MNQILQTPSGIKISISNIQSSKASAIVIAHGFFQSKETNTFKKIEKDLSDNFDIISMDFRGHGKSTGLYTFSALEKEDLKTVLDHAHKHYKKVGVLGFSYGGSIAILEQAEFKNIDSLLCVSSPMASEEVEFVWWTPDAIRLGLKGLEAGAGVRPGNPYMKKVRPMDVVAQVCPTPIFFIHGGKDPTVSQRHSETMHALAKEPKRIHLIPEASHVEEIYRQYPAEFICFVEE